MKKINLIFISLILAISSTIAIAGDWSKIRIGTEGAYEPWNFTDSAGNIVGAEIDLANNLCERMNAECTFVQQDYTEHSKMTMHHSQLNNLYLQYLEKLKDQCLFLA